MSRITVKEAKREHIEQMAGFQLEMAMETEGIELDFDVLCAGIKSVFDEPAKGRYFVAEVDGAVAGSLMITYEWSEWRNRTVYWIQSVFVDSKYRRQGIYRMLYDHVRQLAKKDPTVAGIRLYVESNNLSAQEAYTKLGMDGDHYKVFEWMKD